MPTKRNKGNISAQRLNIPNANPRLRPAHSKRPTARSVDKGSSGESLRRRAATAARQTKAQQQAARRSVRPQQQRPAGTPQARHERNASANSRAQGPRSHSVRRPINPQVLARRILLGVAAVAALLVVGGVADLLVSAGKIHPGVTVQGVEVGGMSVEDAANKLDEELSPRVEGSTVFMYGDEKVATQDGVDLSGDASIEKAYAASETSGSDVDGDGKADKWKLTSNTIGAYVDGAVLAEQAYEVGRQGNFVFDRIGAWVGNARLAATISYSAERYNTLADEVNDTIGKKISNSKAKISSGKATLAEGHDGWALDQDSFTRSLSGAIFGTTQNAIVAPMHTLDRHITPVTAQRVVDQINAAIGTNVTLTYKGSTWTLDAAELGEFVSQKVLKPGEVLTIGAGTEKVETGSEETTSAYDVSAGTDETTGWVLQPYVDQKGFDEYLVGLLGDAATGNAKDASFYIEKGKVKIKPSKTGSGPDRQSAELQLQNILFGSEGANRSISLVDTTIEPAITTEKAKAMGVSEKLGKSWSIPLSGSETRIHNIKVLCKLINGSLVAPGEIWSFNATTGERTEDKGFKKAPVIVSGKHEDQLGGGICQVATCVFNAVCYSGLGIETRANHDFYISAYDDEGFADATVSWEEPDFQWKNDTEHYIYLSASTDSGDVTVSLWGTDDGRTVECKRGEWKKGKKAKTVRENDPELAAGVEKVEQEAVDGRLIYIRYIAKSKSGEVLHNINFKSEYQAQDRIIKVGTKGASSDGSKKGST